MQELTTQWEYFSVLLQEKNWKYLFLKMFLELELLISKTYMNKGFSRLVWQLLEPVTLSLRGSKFYLVFSEGQEKCSKFPCYILDNNIFSQLY